MLVVTTAMMSHTSSKRFFEATLVQIVELLFIFLALSPSIIGLLHTIIVITCFGLVHVYWLGILIFSKARLILCQ